MSVTGPAGGTDPVPQVQDGIHRRIAAGIAGKSVAVVLNFGEQLFLVPVFLLYWGTQQYGEWVALLSAAAFLGLADLGLQSYYGNMLHRAMSRGEPDRFRRLLHQSAALYLAIIAIVAITGFAAVVLVDWKALLSIGAMQSQSVRLTLCLLGAYFILLLPFGVMMSIHRAYGRFDTSVNAGSVYRLALIFAIVTTLALGGTPAMLASSYIVVMVLGYTVALWHLRRRYRGLEARLSWPDRAAFREVATTAPVFATVPLSTMLTLHGTVVVIAGLTGGGAAVVAYTTMRTLTSVARTVTNEILQVAGVEIARQHAQEDHDAIGRLYRFAARLAGATAGVLGGVIAVLGPPFLTLWTLGKVTFAGDVFWPLLAAAVLSGPTAAGASVLRYANRPRGVALGYLLAGVMAIGLSAALIPGQGAAGASWAVLAAEVGVLGIIVPIKAAAIVSIGPLQQLAMTHARAAAGFAVSAFVAWIGVSLAGDGSVAALFAAGLIWIALVAVPVFYLLFDREKRAWIREKVAQRLARRRF